jgi:hypothetical protein
MALMVSLPFSSFAPPELRTASDGTIFVFVAPIVFCAGAVMASCAEVGEVDSRPAATAIMHMSEILSIGLTPCFYFEYVTSEVPD